MCVYVCGGGAGVVRGPNWSLGVNDAFLLLLLNIVPFPASPGIETL